MSTTARHYYAAQWPYGVATNSNTGKPIWNLHRFVSRAVRDTWVEDAPTAYRGHGGYRSAVSSDDRDLRALLRKLERNRELYGLDESHAYLTDIDYASLAEWKAAEEEERAVLAEWGTGA